LKATIWVNRTNEEFWINLENKSGWVNMIIEALKEERKKEIMYETRDNTKEWDEWKNNEE
jgi:hypothetical protein